MANESHSTGSHRNVGLKTKRTEVEVSKVRQHIVPTAFISRSIHVFDEHKHALFPAT